MYFTQLCTHERSIFSTPPHPSNIDAMGYQNIDNQMGIRPTRAAECNQDLLCEYFVSDEGQVPWQENFC